MQLYISSISNRKDFLMWVVYFTMCISCFNKQVDEMLFVPLLSFFFMGQKSLRVEMSPSPCSSVSQSAWRDQVSSTYRRVEGVTDFAPWTGFIWIYREAAVYHKATSFRLDLCFVCKADLCCQMPPICNVFILLNSKFSFLTMMECE